MLSYLQTLEPFAGLGALCRRWSPHQGAVLGTICRRLGFVFLPLELFAHAVTTWRRLDRLQKLEHFADLCTTFALVSAAGGVLIFGG